MQIASKTRAALILLFESGKLVNMSPFVDSLKLKYPKVPRSKLRHKESPTEMCATERQLSRVGCLRLLKTRKLLCWQTKANDMVPMPAKMVELTILEPSRLVLIPCLSPSWNEFETIINTRTTSLKTDKDDVFESEDKCFSRHNGKMTRTENMVIIDSLLNVSVSSSYVFPITVGIQSPIITIYATCAPYAKINIQVVVK